MMKRGIPHIVAEVVDSLVKRALGRRQLGRNNSARSGLTLKIGQLLSLAVEFR